MLYNEPPPGWGIRSAIRRKNENLYKHVSWRPVHCHTSSLMTNGDTKYDRRRWTMRRSYSVRELLMQVMWLFFIIIIGSFNR